MKLDHLRFDGFDWDDGNVSKIQARVPIEDIETFFRQKILIKEDFLHSFSEERFIAIGYTDHPTLFIGKLYV